MAYEKDNAPAVNGFSAGTSLKGTQAYIGRTGMNGRFFPGWIQVNGSVGLFITDKTEKLVTDRIEYLVMSSSCSCFWLNPKDALPRFGLVRLNSDLIGRKMWPEGNVSVSRVAFPSLRQFYIDANNVEVSDRATELLVCEWSDMKIPRPIVKFSSQACGVWAAFKHNNAPTLNGFMIGKSLKNTQVFIGRGWVKGEFTPGRLQIEAPTGVYIELDNEERWDFRSAEYLVLSEGCLCSWNPLESAVNQAGVVSAFIDSNQWLIGRVGLPHGVIAIVKVARVSFVSYYTNELGKTIETRVAEVLVCQTVNG
jgi:hypothetical protein